MYRYVLPMAYSLKQAGEASGRSNPSILRAIQTGKISARKTELGEWEIEPSELHRIYPPVAVGVTRTGTPEREDAAVELLLFRQQLVVKADEWLRRKTGARGSARNTTIRITQRKPGQVAAGS